MPSGLMDKLSATEAGFKSHLGHIYIESYIDNPYGCKHISGPIEVDKKASFWSELFHYKYKLITSVIHLF